MTRPVPAPDFAHFITCRDCGELTEVGEPHTCAPRPGTIRLIDLALAELETERQPSLWARAAVYAVPCILIGVAAALIWA